MVFQGADASGFEADARLTAMWLWTLKAGDGTADNADDTDDAENGAAETEEDATVKPGKLKSGFVLEYDAARKIAQGLGADLESLNSLIEVKGDTARLLPVIERTRHLFGKDPEEPARRSRKPVTQRDLFEKLLNETETTIGWRENVLKPAATTLDRVHQSVLLFATSRSEALKRFLVDDGAGGDPRFWRLAQALSALYPGASEEKRWVDGVLARKKGLGL